MDRTKQIELQQEFIDKYLKGNKKTCYDISVRVGKTRIACLIAKELKCKKVLVLYPFEDIKNAWEEEWDKINWKPKEVVYSTYLSIRKHIEKFDIIFGDEIQKASNDKLQALNELLNINDNFLGLSGTYSSSTKADLWQFCNLEVSETYSSEQAIQDNIIANYQVIVKLYELNDVKQIEKKGKKGKYYTTEKKHLKTLNNRIINTSGELQKLARLNRMRYVNNCESAKLVTKKLIKELENKRYLLYGPDIKFIEEMEIPTYHSKNLKQGNLNKFLNEEINKLGLCQLANQGVTFHNLDTIIIANINSNSENLFQKLARSLLLENNKKSIIYIISSNEYFQLKWLEKALENIPEEKIKIVKN